MDGFQVAKKVPVSDLVKEGDIEENVFLEFCEKNNIGLPKSIKKSKLPNRRITPFTDYGNNRDYGNSRCGGNDTPPNRPDYGSSRC